jgi:hypothetical protein
MMSLGDFRRDQTANIQEHTFDYRDGRCLGFSSLEILLTMGVLLSPSEERGRTKKTACGANMVGR